jgi:hypothetical protein
VYGTSLVASVCVRAAGQAHRERTFLHLSYSCAPFSLDSPVLIELDGIDLRCLPGVNRDFPPGQAL